MVFSFLHLEILNTFLFIVDKFLFCKTKYFVLNAACQLNDICNLIWGQCKQLITFTITIMIVRSYYYTFVVLLTKNNNVGGMFYSTALQRIVNYVKDPVEISQNVIHKKYGTAILLSHLFYCCGLWLTCKPRLFH